MEDDFESLNFPVFKTPHPEHAPMSMDEFDAFNMDDMQDAFDREAYEIEKIRRAVNVMFRIVD
jgi:hypothetical protein